MTSKPVGLSRDLPPARVMRAEVNGQDVVVWRANDGTLAAWNNRCPHRGMALSHGFVRGNTLACLYHGWHYGPSGRCTLIPAHPDLEPPETIHTQQYAAQERGGVIWVALTGAAEAEDTDLEPLRSLSIDAPETTVHAASLATPFDGKLCDQGDDGRLRFGRLVVAVLSNPSSRGTQISVLVSAGLGVEVRKKLSRWCDSLRRRAEAGAAT